MEIRVTTFPPFCRSLSSRSYTLIEMPSILWIVYYAAAAHWEMTRMFLTRRRDIHKERRRTFFLATVTEQYVSY